MGEKAVGKFKADDQWLGHWTALKMHHGPRHAMPTFAVLAEAKVIETTCLWENFPMFPSKTWLYL